MCSIPHPPFRTQTSIFALEPPIGSVPVAHLLPGNYQKGEFEDIDSIKNGIVGQKGKVVVTFGDVIDNSFETAEEFVAEVDRQIISQYAIHPSNEAALALQQGLPSSDKAFSTYLEACPQDLRETVLAMYANPLKQQQKQLNS